MSRGKDCPHEEHGFGYEQCCTPVRSRGCKVRRPADRGLGGEGHTQARAIAAYALLLCIGGFELFEDGTDLVFHLQRIPDPMVMKRSFPVAFTVLQIKSIMPSCALFSKHYIRRREAPKR